MEAVIIIYFRNEVNTLAVCRSPWTTRTIDGGQARLLALAYFFLVIGDQSNHYQGRIRLQKNGLVLKALDICQERSPT